uniref:Sec-independent protein secretion pathway n=1 Tax=Cylindrotheca closterium TaxID=2856 RepID=A0A2U9GHT2_9STRA|nr:Sec-independent protein secretion pathway [Cylindrotheca closterium]AWQ64046.1 Sec-independent protein secretion pathway [Cylindrotheca closterium]
MRISIGQIIIVVLIIFLLFGDIQKLKTTLRKLIDKFNKFLK